MDHSVLQNPHTFLPLDSSHFVHLFRPESFVHFLTFVRYITHAYWTWTEVVMASCVCVYPESGGVKAREEKLQNLNAVTQGLLWEVKLQRILSGSLFSLLESMDYETKMLKTWGKDCLWRMHKSSSLRSKGIFSQSRMVFFFFFKQCTQRHKSGKPRVRWPEMDWAQLIVLTKNPMERKASKGLEGADRKDSSAEGGKQAPTSPTEGMAFYLESVGFRANQGDGVLLQNHR